MAAISPAHRSTLTNHMQRNSQSKRQCVQCGKRTSGWQPILEIHVCLDCRLTNPDKYGLITKTRALGGYRLRPEELYTLKYYARRNPHYSSAARMQLFALPQVQELAKRKWGSPEPYIVTLAEFLDELLAWFLEDMGRLRQLPADKFQYLIADRLERLGLEAQMVGNINRKDGGVDIVAYPKLATVPFLLAVQAKHHHTERKTGPSDVRDFHGVLMSRGSPFHLGMIVTNTTFTPDAKWFADNNKTFLRLRDIQDLRRWLKEDFVNEHEWREIPEEVQLAPGIIIQIPRPRIWTPNGEP